MKIKFKLLAAGILLSLACSRSTFAQLYLNTRENYAFIPVSPADGQFRWPSTVPDTADQAARRLSISAVKVFRQDGKTAGTEENAYYYAPSGQLLPVQRDAHPLFKTFSFTGEGQPLLLHYEWISSYGCGSGGYHTIYPHRSYRYGYTGSLLTELEESDTSGRLGKAEPEEREPEERQPDLIIGSRTSLRYDSAGRLLSRTERSLDLSGQTQYVRWHKVYQHDSQGRLTRIVAWRDRLPEHPEIMLSLPSDFTLDLLRKAPYWRDSVWSWLYGDLRGMGREASAAMLADLRRRDSLSAGNFGSVHSNFCFLTQFSYTGQGRLCEILNFWRDELQAKDTFLYDTAGRLTQWRSYALPGTTYDDLWSESRDFTYEKQRITGYKMQASRASSFQPPWRQLVPVCSIEGTLQYNSKGAVQTVHRCKEDYSSISSNIYRSEDQYGLQCEFFNQ